MKQIILSILMVIMTSLTFGQSKTITPNVSLFYGTQNTFGVDFVVGKNDIVYGGGVSFYAGKGGIGTEYTGIFGPNTYSNEIYDTPIKKDMSVYCIFGRKLNDNTTIISKIGLGTQVKYYNGYGTSPTYPTSSPSGYWFLREYSGADVIVGSVIQHKVKHLITYIGYDTFNGVTVGIGVNLN
jgi:hypothetical protein